MSFVVQRGKARLELPGRSIRVGTHSSCDLVVDDPVAAGVHVTLSLGGGGLELVTGESTLGTYVDGVAVAGSCALQAGSEVVLGASRLQVEAVDPGAATASLVLQERSFFHVAKRRGEFHSDADEWVRSETRFGRIRSLRWVNAVAGLLLLVAAGTFFQDEGDLGAWRPQAVSAASLGSVHALSDAHARVFQLVASGDHGYGAAVEAAAAMGCAACHAEGGVDYVGAAAAADVSAGCAVCHQDVIGQMGVQPDQGGRHPFDLQESASTCSQCHREHRGGEVPQHGFQEGLRCEACHSEGRGELNRDHVSSQGGASLTPVAIQPSRGFEGFSHAAHSAVNCVECHGHGNDGEGYTVPVGFESCTECHRTGSGKEVPFTVTLTADEHANVGENKCTRCHEAVLDPKLKGLMGPQAALAALLVPNHGHDDLIEQQQDCRDCHLKPIAPRPASEGARRPFDHARHLSPEELRKGDAASCAGCHAGMAQTEGRSASAEMWAQTWNTCKECHDRGAFQAPEPRERRTAGLADFHHADHAAQDCRECHVTSGPEGGALQPGPARVERMVEGVSCQTCHFEDGERRHQHVPGTEDCMHCHGQLSEVAAWLEGSKPRRENGAEPSTRNRSIHSRHDGLVSCAACHLGGEGASRDELVVPNEVSQGMCLECHQKSRFHWRYASPR